MNMKRFRRALGQFPTGVTVITTVAPDKQPIGVTASSFNSVSMDPPLILWSVSKSAYSAKIFEGGSCFVVNVLGKHQTALSNNFARQGEDKFEKVRFTEGIGGCPVLEDSAAHFECKTWNTYDGGDHIIVVGEVIEFQASDSTMPLVFARGSYSVATPQPVTRVESGVELSENGFLSNYLLYLLNQAHALYAAELYPLLMSECGVAPEEWRVLTLLADTNSINLSQLARLAMQPEEECADCVGGLVDRGFVVVDGEGIVSINSTGSDLASKLFAVAKAHEQTVLRSLDTDEQKHINASLARMISAFGHPTSGTRNQESTR